MRFLILSFAVFASNHAIEAEPQFSDDGISGIVEFDTQDPKSAFGMHLSDEFDPDLTEARAVNAKKNGDFETAFHDFWAMCESGRPNSCLDAAMLADTKIVDQVPIQVVEHLYGLACAGGLAVACYLPADRTDVIAP